MCVVSGLQPFLDGVYPGKSFLQALHELLLCHDEQFPVWEVKMPQSLVQTIKSRKKVF